MFVCVQAYKYVDVLKLSHLVEKWRRGGGGEALGKRLVGGVVKNIDFSGIVCGTKVFRKKMEKIFFVSIFPSALG